MIKAKLLFLIIGAAMLLAGMGCGAVGVYDPQATQVAMEGTVTSLQATISALEGRLDQGSSAPAEEIRVVTITPTPVESTSVTSATVIPASSLEQIIQLTPTPSPVAITTRDNVVTLVATFTPTPTPEQHAEAPIISAPRQGAVVEQGREILLQWSWNGILKSNEYFDIKIKPDGQTRSAYVAWERGEGHTLKADLAPGRYYWTVQLLQGHYKNNSGEPEDRIFEAFTSPESEPRLLIVAARDDDDDDRRKTPPPPPPPPPPLGPIWMETETKETPPAIAATQTHPPAMSR